MSKRTQAPPPEIVTFVRERLAELGTLRCATELGVSRTVVLAAIAADAGPGISAGSLALLREARRRRVA